MKVETIGRRTTASVTTRVCAIVIRSTVQNFPIEMPFSDAYTCIMINSNIYMKIKTNDYKQLVIYMYNMSSIFN